MSARSRICQSVPLAASHGQEPPFGTLRVGARMIGSVQSRRFKLARGRTNVALYSATDLAADEREERRTALDIRGRTRCHHDRADGAQDEPCLTDGGGCTVVPA